MGSPDGDSSPPASIDALQVQLTEVATVDAPTALVARPGHPDQLFIAERAGRVRLAWRDAASGTIEVDDAPVIDRSDDIAVVGEQGLLGLAFDESGDTLYLSSNDLDGDTRVEAVALTGDDAPVAGERRVILRVDQPSTTNHKGGDLQRGPDGLLYLGLGDGGGQGDPDARAQDLDDLLGKVIRFDPDALGADGLVAEPEIYVVGVRNPWRFSFDADTGDLWIGDVGQDAREEVNRILADTPAGVNLGWSAFEGSQVYREDRQAPGAVGPLFEEHHDDGSCAITGGFVYRGGAIPDLVGTYLYSDLCRSGVRALQVPAGSTDPDAVAAGDLRGTDAAEQVIAFGVDADGELYVLSLAGTIWRIDPA